MAIAVFAFVLGVFVILKEVAGPFASGQITGQMFAYLVAITIPGVLPYALPMGLLTAILLVLGRLSAQNEIVAMKAAGMSLWRITAPVILLGLIGVAISAVINVSYAPVADRAFRETLRSAAQTDPLRFFSPRTFVKHFPGYVIFADRREGDELREINVWELDEHQRAIRHLQGQRALLGFDEEAGEIVLTVYNANGQIIDPDMPPSDQDATHVVEFQESEFRLPLDQLLGEGRGQAKLAFMTLQQLLQLRRDAIDDGGEGSFERRIELQTAIQKKFSFSFAVLSLALVAIPLGIKASRTETYANFALALALAMCYFLTFVLCSWLEKNPALRPDLLIWAPNFFFQGLGGALYWRAARQ